MIVVTQKFIFACVILSCANKVHASPKTNFSFKKTFLTPKEYYEKRNEELDKCEILERSNFSSGEVEDKKDSSSKSKEDVPKVVANAHIHVRFGGDSNPPPMVRTEKYIEMPPKSQNCPLRKNADETEGNIPTNQEWYFQSSNTGHRSWVPPHLPPNQHGYPPSALNQYPPVFPSFNPYYYHALNGHPFGQMYGLPALTPMSGHCPYQSYHQNFNFSPFANHIGHPPCAGHNGHEFSASQNGNQPCPKQNGNQPCPKKNGNQPCACTAKPYPVSNSTEASFVYFFHKNADGSVPSTEEIKKQPTEELTDEHLRLLAPFLDIDEEEQGGEGKKWVFADESGGTIKCSDSTTSNSPDLNKPIAACPKATHKCSLDVNGITDDVILTKVEQSTTCKDTFHDNVTLSDNLKFEKVNLSDLTNSTRKCSCSRDCRRCGLTHGMDDSCCKTCGSVDCSSCNCLHKSKGTACRPIHDMDDLVRVRENAVCSSNNPHGLPYQTYPYGDPRLINFQPWMNDFRPNWIPSGSANVPSSGCSSR